ncbi:chemotaxis protein CheD [Candidatus Poribacteria bacterium]|nr:chemotaxis protein CheD [Candidatus Poribacteria bacterium]
MNHTVGIAEMKVSKHERDVLVTYSLGSCIGLSLYDPIARVGGMIHCMLPLSKIDPAKAQANPSMFTDTGIVALLQAVFDLGAERRNLVAKAAGCGELLDEKGLFKIGERNYAVLRKILWKNNILISGEDVGGSLPRTMFLHMADGKTVVKTRNGEAEL